MKDDFMCPPSASDEASSGKRGSDAHPVAMVDRVARAIEISLFNDHDDHGCRIDGPRDGQDAVIYGHVNFPALARAALLAMREPTEEMIGLGFQEIKPDGLPADRGDAAACWRVMVDAALQHSGLPEPELSFPEEHPQDATEGTNQIPSQGGSRMSEYQREQEISTEGQRTEFVVIVGNGRVALETRGLWPSRTFDLSAYIREEIRKALESAQSAEP